MTLPFSNMLGILLGLLIVVVGMALWYGHDTRRLSLRAAWSIGVVVVVGCLALLTVTIRYESNQVREANTTRCEQESAGVWRCQQGGDG